MSSDRYIAKCKDCNTYTSALIHNVNQANQTGDLHEIRGYKCLHCRRCGKSRIARWVKGKYSEKHKCGSRCMASTGPNCECSCGGKNHGANYG